MPIDSASGNVHLEYEEVSVPGKVNLLWERRYSGTLLSREGGILGKGWTCRYEATLTRHPDRFDFVAPGGGIESIADTAGLVEQGKTVRYLAGFLEVFQDRDRYVVQSWNVDSGEVWRYCFPTGPRGQPLPLLAVEDITGQGVDVGRDALGRVVTIRQRLEQRELRLGYNSKGQVLTVTLFSPTGESQRISRYEHDSKGHLMTAFDAMDYADRYEYDAENRIIREMGRDGSVFTYGYDNQGRCDRRSGLDRYDEKRLRFMERLRITEVTDSYGATTRFQARADGQLTSEWDPRGSEIRTEYDENGRIIAKISATGATTRYSYDERGNRCRFVTPLGDTTEIVFNDHHQPTLFIDAAGRSWRREYDRSSRMINATDPAGGRWILNYDANGNLTLVTNPRGNERRFRYDNGVLTEATDWQGQAARFEHNILGRMSARVDAEGRRYEYQFDRVGNLTRVWLPDGTEIRASYDAGRNLTKFTNAAGRATVSRYGPCRRLLERVDANGNHVSFEWGTEPRRLDKFTNEKGETYRFEYDSAGNCCVESTFDGRELRFDYDPDGWFVKVTNGAGEAIQFARDPLGRITRLNLPDGQSAKFVYDKLGNLVQALNGECAVSFERDHLGRITREVQGDHWVHYDLDAVGNLKQLTTDLGFQVNYEQDPNGFWTDLRSGEGKIQFRRDATGREIQRCLPSGQVLENRFDSSALLVEQRVTEGRLSPLAQNSRKWTTPGRTIIRRIYTRDQTGLVTGIIDTAAGESKYECDASERLMRVTGPRHHGERYEYDAAGNLTHRVIDGKSRMGDNPLTYRRGNVLANSARTRYEYDNQGRLLRKIDDPDSVEPREWRFEWDALDQLRAVLTPDGEVWRYGYDALGRRVRKSGPGEELQFVWSGNVPIIERSNNEKAWKGWIYDQQSFIPLAEIKGRRMLSFISDHLGTPLEVVDDDGHIVEKLAFSAYGIAIADSADTADCRFRFPGQYYDRETGLHYNRFRYYDPFTARFISPDPFGLKGGQNLYLYATNPFEWVDPLGLCPFVTGGFPHEEEAAINATLAHIDANTVPPGPTGVRWGVPYRNRPPPHGDQLPGGEVHMLPSQFSEHRVAPAPGTPGAGPRRIVVDHSTGAVYYTWTHYGDTGPPSFVRIR